MTFAADVLRRRGWTNHLVEDIEFQLEALLDGHAVDFAADAVVEAEMPTTLDASRTQHERWERGRLEMARRYLPSLVRAAVSGPLDRRVYLDAAIDLAVPPLSILVAATGAVAGVALVVAAVAPSAASLRRAAAGIALGVAETGVVLSALRMVRASPAVYRSLLGAPRLVTWKVALWVRVAARRGDVAWVRTPRNEEIPTTALASAAIGGASA
jgi:hypothetical protein